VRFLRMRSQSVFLERRCGDSSFNGLLPIGAVCSVFARIRFAARIVRPMRARRLEVGEMHHICVLRAPFKGSHSERGCGGSHFTSFLPIFSSLQYFFQESFRHIAQ